MKESQIQAACKALLNSLRLAGKPVVVTRTNSGQVKTEGGYYFMGCTEGWPDLSAIVAGQFVGIETKRLKGKQRETQIKMQMQIEAAGGTYLLVDRMEVLRCYLVERGLL